MCRGSSQDWLLMPLVITQTVLRPNHWVPETYRCSRACCRDAPTRVPCGTLPLLLKYWADQVSLWGSLITYLLDSDKFHKRVEMLQIIRSWHVWGTLWWKFQAFIWHQYWSGTGEKFSHVPTRKATLGDAVSHKTQIAFCSQIYLTHLIDHTRAAQLIVRPHNHLEVGWKWRAVPSYAHSVNWVIQALAVSTNQHPQTQGLPPREAAGN